MVCLQDPPQCLKSLFRVHSSRFLSYSRKRKISQNDHLLSLVVIRCHSLSFVITGCLSLYHSLSIVVPLVVIRCHLKYHSSVFLYTISGGCFWTFTIFSNFAISPFFSMFINSYRMTRFSFRIDIFSKNDHK